MRFFSYLMTTTIMLIASSYAASIDLSYSLTNDEDLNFFISNFAERYEGEIDWRRVPPEQYGAIEKHQKDNVEKMINEYHSLSKKPATAYEVHSFLSPYVERLDSLKSQLETQWEKDNPGPFNYKIYPSPEF